MHETDEFKQMEDRIARLELLVQSCTRIACQSEANARYAAITEREIHTDLQYGRGDYGQPMAPETEKGMGAAA